MGPDISWSPVWTQTYNHLMEPGMDPDISWSPVWAPISSLLLNTTQFTFILPSPSHLLICEHLVAKHDPFSIH